MADEKNVKNVPINAGKLSVKAVTTARAIRENPNEEDRIPNYQTVSDAYGSGEQKSKMGSDDISTNPWTVPISYEAYAKGRGMRWKRREPKKRTPLWRLISRRLKNAEVSMNNAISDAQNAYAKSLPTYGANAEALARSGLKNTGYGEYLASQAYAQKRNDINAAQIAYGQQKSAAEYDKGLQIAQNNLEAAQENAGIDAQVSEDVRKAYAGILESANSGDYDPNVIAAYAKQIGLPDDAVDTVRSAAQNAIDKANAQDDLQLSDTFRSMYSSIMEQAMKGSIDPDVIRSYATTIGLPQNYVDSLTSVASTAYENAQAAIAAEEEAARKAEEEANKKAEEEKAKAADTAIKNAIDIVQKNPETPDAEIESYAAANGLTDDQTQDIKDSRDEAKNKAKIDALGENVLSIMLSGDVSSSNFALAVQDFKEAGGSDQELSDNAKAYLKKLKANLKDDGADWSFADKTTYYKAIQGLFESGALTKNDRDEAMREEFDIVNVTNNVTISEENSKITYGNEKYKLKKTSVSGEEKAFLNTIGNGEKKDTNLNWATQFIEKLGKMHGTSIKR